MARKPSKTTLLRKLLQDIPENRRGEASQLAEEILLLQDKMEEIKPDFESEPIVEEYDNGGGQTGTRENPTHTAYQRMLRSWMNAIHALDAMREPEKRSDFPSWLV